MLRKHNKLVILLVLVTFMFSIVGAASAAKFSDVTGTTATTSAVYKLNSLGIIDGYPDGTFGPDKTITRAEFAKIAVYTAGLEDVASGMKGVPSAFTDVAADHWANGWINVAASQGFVKGYGNGTFAPEAQITQAEVITVFLRILGYNDNLPGNWPANYIAKAANLEVLDDVTFMANKAATRGEVAVLGSNTLDENVVVYKADSNTFDEALKDGDPYTLLADKFGDDSNVTEDALVTGVDVSDDGVKLTVKIMNDEDVWETSVITFAEEYTIANVASWNQLSFRFIDYMTNDDGDVVWASFDDYGVIKGVRPDEVENFVYNSTVVADQTKVVKVDVNDKTYSLAGGAVNNTDYFGTNLFGLDVDTKDTFDFVLNEDGDIVYVKANKYENDAAMIVDTVNVDNEKIIALYGGSLALKDKDYVILKGGVPVELDAVKANDLVWARANTYGLDYLVIVANKVVTGSLQSVKSDDDGYLTSVEIADTWYDVALETSAGTTPAYLLSVDNGEEFTQETEVAMIDDTEDYNLFGENVTLMLGPTGLVEAIVSGVEASSNSGVVIKLVDTLVDGEITRAAKILKGDGTEVTYALSDAAEVAIDDVDLFIKYTINDDNELELADGYPLAVEDDVDFDSDEDLGVIGIEDSMYDTNKVVIFNVYTDPADDDADEATIVSVSDFIDWTDTARTAPAIVEFNTSGDLTFIVIDQASLSDSGNIAMVIDKGRDADGNYAVLLLPSGEKKVYLKTGVTVADDTVYNYTMSEGKISSVSATDWLIDTFEVDSVSGNMIKTTDGNFVVDADTLYYDNTEDDPALIEKGDLGSGDYIMIYIDPTETAVDAIVIVDTL